MPSPCPVGSVGPSANRTSLTDCSPCPSGFFCNSSGLIQPTGPCSPGLSPVQNGVRKLVIARTVNVTVISLLSTTGYFCSLGSSEPSPVSKPYGDMCPMGHFCPGGSGSPKPCLVGSFLPEPRASTPTDCHPCPPGKYCLRPGGSQPTGGGFHPASHQLRTSSMSREVKLHQI